MSKTLLFVLMFGCSTSAFASYATSAAASASAGPNVSVTDDGFAAQVREIEKGLSDGKTYAEMSRADRDEVRSLLDRMSNRLKDVDSVDQLPEDEKVELFNEQERVNAMLVKGYADSRLVCDKRGRTGSHFRETSCQTVAERRRRASIDQDNMRSMQRAPMPQEGL